MKVAEFIPSVVDGGAETVVKDYALLLDKNTFEVIVIVLRRNAHTSNDRILTEKGVRIIPIYRHNSLPFKIVQRLNRWWYPSFVLRGLLKKEAVDVLHIHLALLYYVKKIAQSIPKIRLFYTCHSLPERYLFRNKTNEAGAAQYLIQHNKLQMIALHDGMRKEINAMLGIDSTIIIRNGIDFARFKNIPESKSSIRDSLQIPQEAFVMGHVGRFVEVKNHTFLVEIFAELCRRKENAFLLMVGAGELQKQTEQKLDSLGLHGKYLILSHRSDIPQLMKAMEVFVFPSIYEGIPVVLIEAQLVGIRCVASDRVPSETFKTSLAVPVSLEKSAAEWCNILLDGTIHGLENGSIADYDMNKEIKRLEKYYVGRADEA